MEKNLKCKIYYEYMKIIQPPKDCPILILKAIFHQSLSWHASNNSL